MNEAGMLQIPDSRYCFATDRNDLVIHLRIAKEDKDAKVFLVYGDKFEYHDKQSEKEIEIAYQDKTYVYYEVKQHVTDRRFAYIFRFEVEGRSYYFSEDGLTESYDFPNSFYNFFQMPYINEVDIHRPIPWLKDAVFYQIFVDRFAQGDFDKDQSYIDMAWGDKPTPSHFAGGDLKGIIQKLDYLSDLGIKAIYLTPIFLSPTNNKYDIIDYYRVDPQFGSLEDLKTLVTKAHQMGIRVILDAVFNHCSVLAPQFQDVLDKGRESVFYDWFMIEGDYPNPDLLNYETFASCHYMPKWNTSNPKVQDFLISVGLYWIKEADIDGWRLDVSDEVSHQFWRDFRRAVKVV